MSYRFDSASGSVKSVSVASGNARVMCRRADGSLVLVRIYRSLAEALAQCSLLIESHLTKLRAGRKAVLTNPQRPREIYVERWIGSVEQGAWVAVQAGDFNGQVYGRKSTDGKIALCAPRVRFEFLDQPPRIQRAADSSASVESASPTIETPELSSGAHVACLLTGRTKKGGWFAKLAVGEASGPITNAGQMPSSLEVGQSVLLRLNGINSAGRFASFQWVSQPAR